MRLFVAADIPEEVRGAVAAATETWRTRFRFVRWEDAAKYHFTLKFLGEVDAGRVSRVTERLEEASIGVAPFAVRVGGFGSFPPRGDPRIVWAGTAAGGEALTALARAIDEAMRREGFEPERRPFHPHLTIGRAKPRGREEAERLVQALGAGGTEPLGAEFEVDRIRLVESRLEPGGSVYSTVAERGLRGGRDGVRGGR